MTVSQEIAYTEQVTWKDYLQPDEAAELDAVTADKAAATERYRALWKTLKTRCDARMRRDKAAQSDAARQQAKGE